MSPKETSPSKTPSKTSNKTTSKTSSKTKGKAKNTNDKSQASTSLFGKSSWVRKVMRKFLRRNQKRVHIITFDGVISSRPNRGDSIHSHPYLPLISRAFRKGSCDAVVLQINSPGGSPAQSMLIADAIRYHADKSGIPVWAFVEDVAASGGYYIALAADRIYALPSSIIGSIGVIYSGFGLSSFIQRFGIERRVYTAGAHKSLLDPFKEEKTFDTDHLQTLQQQLHKDFISFVKERRSDLKDKQDSDPLFSGLFWLGSEAQTLGLVDEVGVMLRVVRERLGQKVRLASIRPRRFFLSGRPKFRRLDIATMVAEIERWDLESRYKI